MVICNISSSFVFLGGRCNITLLLLVTIQQWKHVSVTAPLLYLVLDNEHRKVNWNASPSQNCGWCKVLLFCTSLAGARCILLTHVYTIITHTHTHTHTLLLYHLQSSSYFAASYHMLLYWSNEYLTATTGEIKQ